MRLRIALRTVAAVGVVAATTLLGTPTHAHHTVNFASHNCATTTPSPDAEPDLTPPPTDPPAGGEGPPVEEAPTPPPQNCMPAEGERIWGTRLLKFSTSTDGARPLKRVALYILSQEESLPSAMNGEPLLEETYTRGEGVTSYDAPFSWNSGEVTPFNGKYKVRVEVDTYPAFTGSDTHRAFAERVDLRVDNPPLSVDAPRIVATTPNSVTMNWTAGPEPDVLSYQVFRAVTKDATRPPYSAFNPIGLSTGPGYRDASVQPGTHWYAVRVTRRSVVTPDDGISSGLSAMSSAATVESLEDLTEDTEDGKAPRRFIPFRNIVQHRPTSRLAQVADAPFAYKLPYDPDSAVPEGSGSFEGSESEGGTTDPRRPVLPVAVGMFLVSSALAVGRMPY